MKITTIIPTFNRKFFLKEAIDSCLMQTKNTDIIVCDHGSTDGTSEMMLDYKNKLHYIRREVDFGPHFCWLEGILNSKTEFVHILFDDDFLKPTFTENCLKYLTPEVGFVFSSSELFNNNTNFIETTFFSNLHSKSGIYRINESETFFVKNLISPSSVVLRKKDAIDALYQGSLPLSKIEYKGVGPDKFLILICLLRYSLYGYIKEPLVVYRYHDNSITIDALKDDNKRKNIRLAYEEINNYYYMNKLSKLINFGKFLKVFHLKYLLSKLINKILNFKND